MDDTQEESKRLKAYVDWANYQPGNSESIGSKAEERGGRLDLFAFLSLFSKLTWPAGAENKRKAVLF